MDDTAKKALAAKLAAKKNAFVNYSSENSKWFIKKVIDYLAGKGTTDGDMETATQAIIDKAKVAVKAREKKGFNNTDVKYKWFAYSDRRSRVQIIYGLIAMHPQFVETADPAYFDFIIERRFRSIQRMMYFVNPTDVRSIFSYQEGACTTYKLNKDAGPSWLSLNIPFVLNSTGTTDPVKAVDWIFKVNKLCDKNILPCDPVATILHMDALQAANNTKKLFDQLITEGGQYFKIDNPVSHLGNTRSGNHLMTETVAVISPGANVQVEVGLIGGFLELAMPAYNFNNSNDNRVFALATPCLINLGDQHEAVNVTGVNPVTKKIVIASVTNTYAAGAKIYLNGHPNYPAYQFLSDSRPDKALFEQKSIKLDDLQVGDNIYVRNHPLYRVFQPRGVWGGEFSFVLEIESRSIKEEVFESSFKVAGHGLTGTMLEMGNNMLDMVNADLGMLQDVAKKHIQNKQMGKYTANVNIVTKTVGGTSFKYYEYDVAIMYTVLVEGEFTAVVRPNGFVIIEDTTRNDLFRVANLDTKDSTAATDFDGIDIFFMGTTFNNTTAYKLSNWGIRYYNTQMGKFESLRLYEPNDLIPASISFDDLKNAGPFISMKQDADVFVTRPRVDFSTTYQDFLVNNGAYVKTP